MRTLIIVIAAIVLSLQVVLTASAIGPTFPINGQVIATSQEDNHRFINAKNTYPTGGNPHNANVGSIQHLSPTGSTAWRFADEVGQEQGAVGYQNGRNVGSGFYLTDSVYLAAGKYNPDSTPVNEGPPKIILGQEGFYNGTYYTSARFLADNDWSIQFRKPDGSPIMTINPDGAVQFHGPVTFASGATIN